MENTRAKIGFLFYIRMLSAFFCATFAMLAKNAIFVAGYKNTGLFLVFDISAAII